MFESIRWQLHSLADWSAARQMWRMSIRLDRLALAIYRWECRK